MTTLLLSERRDASYLTCQRSRELERLLARLRAWTLDTALATGACPDSCAPLSLRAHKLVGQATRRQLAREIHRILREAERPVRPLDARIPICRRKILCAGPISRSLPITC